MKKIDLVKQANNSPKDKPGGGGRIYRKPLDVLVLLKINRLFYLS